MMALGGHVMQVWVALATPVLVAEIIAQQFVGDKPNSEVD
jgi:hypothetical protein